LGVGVWSFSSALFFCWPAGAVESGPGALNLPNHPRLLLNSNGIALLKERNASNPWAKASWAELGATAQKTLNQPIVLPPRGGNWSHNYVCPIHGARLNQGKQVRPWQWEHICPVGHHVLKGDPTRATLDFDGNAIAGIHFNLAQQSVNDGLVYHVTGDARYARKARDILVAYAAKYLSYPLHDNQGKPGQGGRVASQSLTEASWLIEIAQGADLIWNTLSNSERELIETKLLRPALDQVILPRRLGIHNIQCRHNSAIGLVGFLLGDEKLIRIAIDEPEMGFLQQLEKGLREDGMWLEGSSGYHYFTIAGLWPLAEAARNCGRDLYTPRFRAMFDGPLALAMPNLVLPNFNDSGTVPLENQSDFYELAFSRYQKPAYLPLLSNSDRRGRLALLFGSPLPSNTPVRPGIAEGSSRNLTSSGYAILQRGSGENATWLCLKYGPHGGGHGHPDKNSFILYSRGEIIGTDAGTHAYGSPLHRDWDKTTLAHNTLVVDEQSQQPATGACLAFGSEHGVDYAITDAGPIYPGVRFIRTAALLSTNLVLFVDQIQAEQSHIYDLAYHQIGTWAKPANSETSSSPWPVTRATAYNHLSQAITWQGHAGNLAFQTELSKALRPSIVVAPTEATEFVTGYGILKTTEDLTPMLLQRRKAASTAFVLALSLDGPGVALATEQTRDAAGQPLPLSEALVVKVQSGASTWRVFVNPDRRTATSGDGTRTESVIEIR